MGSITSFFQNIIDRYKGKRLIKATTLRALTVYEAMDEKLPRTIHAFALAVISAVNNATRALFIFSKTSEYKAIGNKSDPLILNRFAAFIAWFVHSRWVDETLLQELEMPDDTRDIIARLREKQEAEIGKVRSALTSLDDAGTAIAMARAEYDAQMERLRTALFPDKDAKLQAAIARQRANDQRRAKDDAEMELLLGRRSDGAMLRYIDENWLIVDSLLNFTQVPYTVEDEKYRIERSTEISLIETFALTSFLQTFDELTR